LASQAYWATSTKVPNCSTDLCDLRMDDLCIKETIKVTNIISGVSLAVSAPLLHGSECLGAYII
jgi:hypothetical protein